MEQARLKYLALALLLAVHPCPPRDPATFVGAPTATFSAPGIIGDLFDLMDRWEAHQSNPRCRHTLRERLEEPCWRLYWGSD